MSQTTSPSSGKPYGFRPGRGQHDALDALVVRVEHRSVNWILDADIKVFSDNIATSG